MLPFLVFEHTKRHPTRWCSPFFAGMNAFLVCIFLFVTQIYGTNFSSITQSENNSTTYKHMQYSLLAPLHDITCHHMQHTTLTHQKHAPCTIHHVPPICIMHTHNTHSHCQSRVNRTHTNTTHMELLCG
jgi:hypothetical protein